MKQELITIILIYGWGNQSRQSGNDFPKFTQRVRVEVGILIQAVWI